MKIITRHSLPSLIILGAAFHADGISLRMPDGVAFAQSQPDRNRDHEPRQNSDTTSHLAMVERKVDEYLKPYLNTGNFSGSILIAGRGRIYLSKAYGFADRKNRVPNTPKTIFHLASGSRVFTSAAILLLEQQGRLSVDDKLSRYLPDWPRGEEITIHHLLTLSAGFPNINSLPGYAMWSETRQTPASLCGKFRNLPLEFPTKGNSETFRWNSRQAPSLFIATRITTCSHY